MATRFYSALNSVDTKLQVPKFNYDAGWSLSTSATRYGLSTTKDGATLTTKGVAETSTSGTYDVCIVQLVSKPLAAQTLTGTVKGIFRALESNAAADMMAQCSIRVVGPDGTVRGIALALGSASLASEFATSLTNRKYPLAWSGSGASLTDVTVSDGDFLVVEIGYRATNTVATSYTGSVDVGSSAASDCAENETSTTANNGWIEFSATLLFSDYSTKTSAHNSKKRTDGPVADKASKSSQLSSTKQVQGLAPNPGGGGGGTTHYHKRAWRTDSSEYVTWDTTDPNRAYPGGGTLTPTLGVVLYTWITTP